MAIARTMMFAVNPTDAQLAALSVVELHLAAVMLVAVERVFI